MNLEKNAARAKKLAEQLGVQFTPPSFQESAEKAKKHMSDMAEYRSKKAEYDKFATDLVENYSKDVVLAFIAASKNPK